MPSVCNNFQHHLYDLIELLPSRLKKTQFLTCNVTETSLETVAANSEKSVVSLAASGKLFYVTHYGKGVPCYNMSLQISIDDGPFDGGVYAIGIDAAESYQFNSAGTLYNLGTSALLSRIWDTTNHEYYVINFNLHHEFSDSITIKLCNYDSANDSQQKTKFILDIFVSSKKLKLHSKGFLGDAVREIKEMINKKFGRCSAVLADLSIDEDFSLVNKEESINRLILFIDDEVYKKKKDKVVNCLINENLVHDIIERPRPHVKIGR